MSLFYMRMFSMQATTIEVHTATYYALNGRMLIKYLIVSCIVKET